MHPAIAQLEQANRKPAVPQVQSGDTVRVHQLIREGAKQRVQMFEGVVIRTDRLNSVSASITVRRIASGVGVEKTFLMHSPNVDKIEIMRRGRVRRNFLSYLRDRRGKSARLKEVGFDRAAANDVTVAQVDLPAEEVDPEAADAAVTEIDVDKNQDELDQVEESTDQVAAEEDREAAADEPKSTDGDTEQGDESVMEQEEAESKIDKPDSK